MAYTKLPLGSTLALTSVIHLQSIYAQTDKCNNISPDPENPVLNFTKLER
jgi:hypothetical protein